MFRKKVFLKISQNSQENTCTRVFFNKFEETLAQAFSCEFCKISKNTVFYRTPPVAASPNRGYLHCAILKALHAFQQKTYLKSRDMQFSPQNVSNEIFKIFKVFENNMKFIRAACWINMVINNIRRYYGVIMKVFKVGLSPSKKHDFVCFNESPLKIMKNAFYFKLQTLFVLKIFKFLYWLFGHVKRELD